MAELTEEQRREQLQANIHTHMTAQTTKEGSALQESLGGIAFVQNIAAFDQTFGSQIARTAGELARPLVTVPQEPVLDTTGSKKEKAQKKQKWEADKQARQAKLEEARQAEASAKSLDSKILNGRTAMEGEISAYNFQQAHPEHDWIGIKWGGQDQKGQLAVCDLITRVRESATAHYNDYSEIAGQTKLVDSLMKRLGLCANAFAMNERDITTSLYLRVGHLTEGEQTALNRRMKEQTLVSQAVLKEMSVIEALVSKVVNGDAFELQEKTYLARNGMRSGYDVPGHVPVSGSGDESTPQSFKDKRQADAYHRPRTERAWSRLSPEQKQAAYKYTVQSDPVNMALRGLRFGMPLNEEGAREVLADHQNEIDDLTAAVNASTLEESTMLHRASSTAGLAGMLGISEEALTTENLEKLNRIYNGQLIKDNAFLSTSASSDAEFLTGAEVEYNILARKGTKALYTEPFSHYGTYHKETGDGGGWDGQDQPSGAVGTEAEVLLQRGSRFMVQSIEVGIKDGLQVFTVNLVTHKIGDGVEDWR